MGATTGIEWTDATWNPLRGCSRVSDGCRNCYAEKTAYRFSGAGAPYEGLVTLANGHPQWTGKVSLVEKHLLDPMKWREPRRIFVDSMSDLFHENVPDEWLDKIFAVMALCPHHTFQVLTKRPERMRSYFAVAAGGGRREDAIQRQITDLMLEAIPDRTYDRTLAAMRNGWGGLPLKHVWVGVSVENQKAADERIPLLLQTPAAVRFLSCEPLLGPVDLSIVPRPFEFHQSPYGWHSWWPKKLHWVIAGGESGPGARPMHPAWARSLRDQCQSAGVPFFFKQWGEWAPTSDPSVAQARGVPLEGCMSYVGKKAAGALLDGCEWREFPAR